MFTRNTCLNALTRSRRPRLRNVTPCEYVLHDFVRPLDLLCYNCIQSSKSYGTALLSLHSTQSLPLTEPLSTITDLETGKRSLEIEWDTEEVNGLFG